MNDRLILSLLLIFLFISIFMCLFIGKYPISFNDYISFFKAYFFNEEMDKEKYNILYTLIFDIRLPRILAAIIIGSSLSVAGANYQAMFVNPLVSPGILGVLSGASFGAALGMILGYPWFGIQILTFIFGVLAVSFAIFISFMYSKGNSIIILVLGGVISGSLFSSFLSILKFLADPYNTLPEIVYWLMGSLSFSSKDTILPLFIPMFFGVLLLIFMSKYLNALSLGDDEAKSLGINTTKIKLIIILISTFISALSVMLAGIIGWIGLIIPHITRFIFGADNKKVIPISAILGAIFLLLSDTGTRILLTYEIPIGIFTSLVGIPIFIIILKYAKEGFK